AHVAFLPRFLGNVKVFHGRVQDNQVDLGHWLLPHKEEIRNVHQVAAFVRPQEVELTRDQSAGRLQAQIQHIQPVGSVIRIELKLTDGQFDPIQVEIPRRDYEALSPVTGEQLYLRLLNSRVFPLQAVG